MSASLSDHPIVHLARRFAARLQECAEVQRFRQAEQQINQSETVRHLIETIKRKQKEWVHAKHYQKTEYVRQLEQELDQLQRELDNLPIVREYQQSQVDVNDLLQTIQQVVADTISAKIHVETGGDVSGGCGSGGPCGCK
ncbi:RicAFT regulatory complex protein RicA family protein [Thermoflavimicrobium dichotomicum]|uniref:Cell fate regulator YmcA, YheA/YmcA/DUF963 family (Controls sporulation, competence, biofilm development) n=1 Tax=Thermoflavimicrobium dichotomicum TaxID=46223 RepID=A0A1I3RUQ1_9BACL|nr:YlbF family regulator [Thermoflavimicrobium dichotomicum]SFJ50293.1 Cell fate regulator YmcA, YheA/YmcA/DUF963 family (controls sporulation, competence, biofilm development) [Thermoflavimicrobium dichotomicum]